MEPITMGVILVVGVGAGYLANEKAKRDAQIEADRARKQAKENAEAAKREKDKKRRAQFNTLQLINENLTLYFKTIVAEGKVEDPKHYMICKGASRDCFRIEQKYINNEKEFTEEDKARIQLLQRLLDKKLSPDKYETLFEDLMGKYQEQILEDFYSQVKDLEKAKKSILKQSKEEIHKAKDIIAKVKNRVDRESDSDQDHIEKQSAEETINEHEGNIKALEKQIEDIQFLLTMVWKAKSDPLKGKESQESMRILLKLTNEKPLSVEERIFMNALFMKYKSEMEDKAA